MKEIVQRIFQYKIALPIKIGTILISMRKYTFQDECVEDIHVEQIPRMNVKKIDLDDINRGKKENRDV